MNKIILTTIFLGMFSSLYAEMEIKPNCINKSTKFTGKYSNTICKTNKYGRESVECKRLKRWVMQEWEKGFNPKTCKHDRTLQQTINYITNLHF